MNKELFERSFAYNVAIRIFVRKSFGTHLQLIDTFLARYIKRSFTLHTEYNLQYQRGFPDAGFAAYQYQRTIHQSSSQYPV